MKIWNLTGTDKQVAIATEALSKIKFPFERLTLPGVPELGWRDLNGRGALGGHAIEGELLGRKYTLGVFYPGSGKIFVDNALTTLPGAAEATIVAEIAHAVDEFLPLTEAMRDEFIRLLNDGQPNDNTWWEKSDYNAEYFTLEGEAFMFLFCRAYSDIPFGDVSSFEDQGENVTAEQVRGVIGIERTDASPKDDYVSFGRSVIYHLASHYHRPGTPVTDLSKFRPCKICLKGH